MDQALISVIVPAYNAERWIAETLHSVLDQTIKEIELIVVDDGSTDGTVAVVRGIGDPRLRIIEQRNQGVSAARNSGLDIATGEYIRFLDADDLLLPNDLEVKLSALKEKDLDWVFSDCLVCDERSVRTGEVLRATDGDVIRTILLGSDLAIPTSCSNLLAHRRCFNGGLRMDPTLSNAADQDIAIELARSFRYKRIPQALFLYRVHASSMSRSMALYEKDHLTLFAKARRNGLLEDAAFRNLCMANAYWSIGGSWWVNGRNIGKAIPWLIRAILKRPGILLRSRHKALTRRWAEQGGTTRNRLS